MVAAESILFDVFSLTCCTIHIHIHTYMSLSTGHLCSIFLRVSSNFISFSIVTSKSAQLRGARRIHHPFVSVISGFVQSCSWVLILLNIVSRMHHFGRFCQCGAFEVCTAPERTVHTVQPLPDAP